MEPLQPTRWMRTLCGVAAIAMITQLLFLAEPPFAERLVEATWDKGVHIAAFGALAFLMWVAAGGRWPMLVFALAVVVGAADEVHQIYTPGRTADINDFLADGFGAAAAMILAQAITPAPLQSKQGA